MSYKKYSEKVTDNIAEKRQYKKIIFEMNVDNTACLLVRDESNHLFSEQLSAELTDSFRNNPAGLADEIIKMVTANIKCSNG